MIEAEARTRDDGLDGSDPEALHAERCRLALDVKEGKSGAGRKLVEVEQLIAARDRQRELDGLAEVACAERVREVARKEAEAQRRKLERKRDDLVRRREQALREVQDAIDGLVAPVTRATELDVELHAARRALGEDPARSILRARVAGVIGWRLGTMLPDLGRPRYEYQRRPLVEPEGETK